ncbi:lysylphosphatidylglycerol synthase transmembrane domain-containing protein [Natronosalvus rutilus]|uniref:Flippase-like domain-containing protein n=1 Tax=Natronosalvus rutilus TaxID=2953753 RepID=A0A9E7NBC7_9EURY|nr:lysylphosphatidylglycerol synthase transmembrane domain-containing protein [Natronosalvus rutilus]UTF53793.1 flippase-like domain-containing protein [Natronosalvus rutilus]
MNGRDRLEDDSTTRSRRTASADGRRGRSLEAGLRRFGPFVVAIGIVLGLLVAFRSIELETVLAEVARADRQLLAGAVAVYLLSWPLRGRRYGDVLGTMYYRVGTAPLTAAIFVSQLANLVLPARAGDGARAYIIKNRWGVPYPTGGASLVVERLFDLATITALALGATAWLALSGTASPLEVFTTGGARRAVLAACAVSTATVGVGVVLAASTRYGSPAGLGARLRSHTWGDRLEAGFRFVGHLQAITRRPRSLAAVATTSLAIWSLDVVTAVLVLAAFGTGLDVLPLLAVGTLAVSVGNLAKVLPLSQGGVGLYEAAFTALVVSITPIGASTALAAALVDHALKNGLTLVGGGLSAGALGLTVSGLADERPE